MLLSEINPSLLNREKKMNIQLRIPSQEEKDDIVTAFIKDLESYTVKNEAAGTFEAAICCVCDSMPKKAQSSIFVDISDAASLFDMADMHGKRLTDEFMYPSELINQYRTNHIELEMFVLSPFSFINNKDEILICKDCYSDLKANKKKKKKVRRPPKESIANCYVIGDAPFEMKDLNEVELSLLSRVRLFCQSWTFFGGCHKHIKGWHTFFKNRNCDNVGNLMQLIDSDDNVVKCVLLVVLCGPFTSTQKAMTMQRTAVNPLKVVRAWKWIIINNFNYKDEVIPHIDSIPTPTVIHENL